MTSADRHYLAGLIDGEGCFSIAYNGPRTKSGTRNYQCRMALAVRADDSEGIEALHDLLGFGHVRYSNRKDRSRVVTWSVESKADCLRLVRVLDLAPLRLKKRRDYDLWRSAVLEWQRPDYDRDELRRIRAEIMRGRAYQEGRGATDRIRDGSPIASRRGATLREAADARTGKEPRANTLTGLEP